MGRTTSAQQLVWWRTDGFVCALVAAIVVAGASAMGWVHRLDMAIYDAAVGSASAEPAADLAVVGIDERSFKALGPWPWQPEVHARFVDQLTAAGARAIAYTMPLPETPARPLPASIPAAPGEPTAAGVSGAEIAAPTGDARLALSLQRAGNVVLVSQYAATGPAAPLPSYVRRSVLPDPGEHAVPAASGRHPSATLGAAASAIGHLQLAPDPDGVLRHMPLLLAHDNAAVPSVALLTALRSLQLGQADLRLQASAPWLRLGSLGIATDSTSVLRPLFRAQDGGQPVFARTAFAQVLTAAPGASGFQGKTVLVGFTSAAQAAPMATPGGQSLYPVEVLAQMVSAIRQGHAVTAPDWAAPVAWLAIAAAVLYLALALPQVSALAGLAVSVALLLALVGAQWLALEHALLSFSLLGAALAVAVGQLTMLALKLRGQGGASRAKSAEAAESKRMLGLALHGQGKLEQAFEHFRRLPMTEALKDNLYHLAQDFERKRNYAMAKLVYERILRHDRQYKDAKLRYRKMRARAKSASGQPDTAPPSSAPMPMPSVSAKPRLPGDATIGLPMLGRYEITKEIGKGSMGVVYLGRDPKIGRMVAIKTLALGQEFEGDGLIDARARFFREAETAGRLQHPYIVTIFDAGEEHDLAYISMEFLKGTDLSPFCKEGNLLPVPLALSVAARVAEALDYAHANQVVHRDIKPANVMFDAATDAVKVTDFGIARLTDSNKTRTGLVLGTPSFMSPEQLAGKKVDGRSDLYSLGVTLFQMLTGSLPLRGASMPELMHKIASVPAPDVRTLRPELPAEVAEVVALSMMKRPEARYQTGRQFAAEIRRALAALAGTESGPNQRTVVYDAARKATGHDMADFQETVMEYPVDGGSPLPPASAR
ncbi:serine/threonine-protein kinase [Acidovorax sp.]|uniref:CHASE2 domain-containing serine/threonine-protein kinase n=1 Tax=Acidovorax sp. TaxID=1872122 RepID=UPI002ACEA8B4|nr:serine/threonine-protein kinase [Acidovorax sp.]MDZ7861366.1 serine/threonine-protein kinase [Acidovorax sp.]